MATVVRIKRRSTGNAGAPASLQNAELAYNEVDDVLYYGKGTGGAGGTATTIPAIAGAGAYVTRATTQSISGNKTFTGTVNLTGALVDVATAVLSDNSTSPASTAFVKGQGYISGNESITFTGDATGTGTTAVTLTLANVVTAGTAPKVTFNSKGLITGTSVLIESDIPTLTTAKISNFNTAVTAFRLDQFAAPTASLDLNGQRLTNLGSPIADTDVASKAYVDATASGIDFKDSVVALADTNITISGEQTIDGVALLSGDRVLLVGQTNAAENGIYVVSAGAWSRSADADNSPAGEVTAGMLAYVEEGTTHGGSQWVLATVDPITLGSTNLNFVQFSGAAQVNAGAGLVKTGNSIDAVGTANRISVLADSIDIAATYVGQTSITTLGTVTTGTWNASLITEVYGGTGISTYAAGDLLYADAINSLAVLAKPAVDSMLTMDATGVPTWVAFNATDITSLGIVTTGTWNADIIALAYGGTGADLSAQPDGTIFKKAGTAFVAAIAGTDYVDPNGTIDGGTF